MSLGQTPRWMRDNKFDRFTVPIILDATEVDRWAWIAHRPCQVKSIKELHSVVGGASAVLRPRKVLAAATDAPGATAGTNVRELTTADFDLTTAIDTTVTGTLVATIAHLQFRTGDKLGFNTGGTLTGIKGLVVIEFQEID